MFGGLFSAGESAPLPIKIKNTSGGGVPQVYRKATYVCPQPEGRRCVLLVFNERS